MYGASSVKWAKNYDLRHSFTGQKSPPHLHWRFTSLIWSANLKEDPRASQDVSNLPVVFHWVMRGGFLG